MKCIYKILAQIVNNLKRNIELKIPELISTSLTGNYLWNVNVKRHFIISLKAKLLNHNIGHICNWYCVL